MRLLVGLLMGVLLLPGTVLAQYKTDAMPFISPGYPGGYYNPPTESALNVVATFDGEGEAEVAVELAVMNDGAEPLNELSLTIPGTELRLVRTIQETKETTEQCYFGQTAPCPKQDTAIYKTLAPATSENDGTEVKLPLAQSIPSAEGRRVYLVYKVMGYTTQRLGQFKSDFPTPKVAVDLANVTVNVRVTDGLFLKGGKSSTDYQKNSVAEGILSAPLDTATSELAMNRFSGLQYEAAGITKNTSSLDPNEVFHVKATYAQQWVSIYWPMVGLGILALALLGVVLWYGEQSVAKSATGKEQA